MITKMLSIGYPQPEHGLENVLVQPECAGIDYYGFEILEGDDIVEFDGEVILKDNLERFLSEELGFKFRVAN
jgi:hypothetical protein